MLILKKKSADNKKACRKELKAFINIYDCGEQHVTMIRICHRDQQMALRGRDTRTRIKTHIQ